MHQRGIENINFSKIMKIRYSLPRNESFFNSYATLTPTLVKLGFLAQIVSALTEIGILYGLIYSSLIDFFPYLAAPFAAMGSLLATAFLEIGLRKFIPYSARSILFKRFESLHLVMTAFILFVSLGLLFSSAYLSFEGSKQLVKEIAPEATQESFEGIDTFYYSEIAEIKDRYNVQSDVLSNKIATEIKAENISLEKFLDLEKRTGKKYTTRKSRIKERIAQIESEGVNQLAQLEFLRAEELSNAQKRRIGKREQIEKANEQSRTEMDKLSGKYGHGLAYFTVICILVFVVSIILDEVHKKGAGIEEVPLPNQYYFSQSIFGEFLAMLSEKVNYTLRNFIKKQAEKTPPPPEPSGLPVLYDISEKRNTPVPNSNQIFENGELDNLIDSLLNSVDDGQGAIHYNGLHYMK
jgi:hypothetical protein